MNMPSFTKIYRKASYPTIDPSRPDLSTKDKTVIVTGAGHGGIGEAAALALVQAGARKIALIGRTEATLSKTKTTIEQAFPDATVLIAVADVSKSESVGTVAHYIRTELGAWDIFANVAG
jgi:NADP-dependent 3-hydroxy acid dehydrogenase YdfG